MSSKLKYSRAELLVLALKPHEYALSAGALQKFGVIEAESPAEASQPEQPAGGGGGGGGDGGAGRKVTGGKNNNGGRRGAANNSSNNNNSSSNNNNNGGNGNNNNSNSNNNNNTNNERFAPPARGWRGTRDQEAFEEGYKYELERNAMKKQALQETMAKEQQRSDTAAREEARQQKTPVVPEERKSSEDEMERLLTSIAAADEGPRRVTRSRFFPGGDSDTSRATTTAASFAPAPSPKDQWSVTAMLPTSGPVVWNNNADKQRPTGSAPEPPAVVVGSPPAPLSSPPATSAPNAAPSAGAAGAGESGAGRPATGAWNAQELEQLLLRGQPTDKSAPKAQPIDAAMLESQLLRQVRQTAPRPALPSSQIIGAPPPPPPQPPQLPAQSMPMGEGPRAGTPPGLMPSGQRTPPQVPVPAPPPHMAQPIPMAMPWGMSMAKGPAMHMAPQRLMQPQGQPPGQPQGQPRHLSMRQPMPIVMGDGRGGQFYPQPQTMPGHFVTGYMLNQGQQTMILCRAADGTTQYALGAPGYPPNMHFTQQPPPPQQRR